VVSPTVFTRIKRKKARESEETLKVQEFSKNGCFAKEFYVRTKYFDGNMLRIPFIEEHSERNMLCIPFTEEHSEGNMLYIPFTEEHIEGNMLCIAFTAEHIDGNMLWIPFKRGNLGGGNGGGTKGASHLILSLAKRCCMMLGMRVLLRGLHCLSVLGVVASVYAVPQYKWSIMTPLKPEDSGPLALMRDCNPDGTLNYGYDPSIQRYWDGTKITRFTDARGFQSNSAGEMVTNVWFRRSLNSPEERIPLWNGRGGLIQGITENGDVYGGYGTSDPIYGYTAIPFIYNIRTGQLTIVERPVEHTEPNGSIAKMDDHGRYVIAGWGIWKGDATRGTLVDPRGNSRLLLGGFEPLRMNGIGGAIAVTTVKGRYAFAGSVRELPLLQADSISDDLIIPFWDFGYGEDLSLHQIVGNDYVKYMIHDVTPGLPSDMRVNHGITRPDGTIAAFGERNGQYYILQFTPVPEPASLIAVGIGCLALRRRARKSGHSL